MTEQKIESSFSSAMCGVDTDSPKPPRPTGQTEITAILTTNLHAYPTSPEERERLKSLFVKEFLQLDGVEDYTIYTNGVSLTIRTAVTSVEEVKSHLQRLFDSHAKDKESEFLPFFNGSPVIEWRVSEIMR